MTAREREGLPAATVGPAPAAPVAREGYIAALAALELVGPARLRWLRACGPPGEVWHRLVAGTLDPGDGPQPPVDPAGRFDAALSRWSAQARGQAGLPERMASRLDRLGVEVDGGDSMPEVLGSDPDPPGAVFRRGRTLDGSVPRVAVVGTRRASGYGQRVAESLGRALSEAGVSVVSGLALGIDAAAHRGALQGPTPAVAVIGAGHDRPCPVRNRALAERLVETGSVLSEVPPGIASAPWRYPVRNRLIAALADVLVVVESAAAGGSMLTVAEALGRDRPVMAVPGPIDHRASVGCHDLLRDGAEICTGVSDVLTLLGLCRGGEQPPPPPAPQLSAAAASVLAALAEGPMATDTVMALTGAGLA